MEYFFELIDDGRIKDLEKEIEVRPDKIEVKNSYGDSPLYYSCSLGQTAIVILLLHCGANIHEKHKYHGYTALHKACEKGFIDIVKLLISKNANVLDKTTDGENTLHIAAENGHINVVSALLDAGVNINDTGNGGNTALHLAAQKGHLSIVKLLLERGAYSHETDDEGHSTLYKACSEGHVDVVNLLIESRCDVNTKSYDKTTALHAAAVHGHTNVIDILLDHGANIDEQSRDNSTPMHVACRFGHKEVSLLLIQRGCNVHLKSIEGYTPMHSACLSNNEELIMTLIEENLSTNEKDNLGRKPIELIDDPFIRNYLLSYFITRYRAAENNVCLLEIQNKQLSENNNRVLEDITSLKASTSARIANMENSAIEQRELNSNLTAQVEAITDLKIELSKEKNTNIELNAALQEVRSYNSVLELQFASSKKEASIIAEDLSLLRITQREKEISYTDEIRSLRSRMKQLQEICDNKSTLEIDLATTKQELAIVNGEMYQLRSILKEKDIQKSEDDRNTQNISKEVWLLRDSRATIELELTGSIKENDLLKEELGALKEKMREKEIIHNDFNRNINTLNKTIQDLKDQKGSLEIELHALKKEASNFTEEIMNLRSNGREKEILYNEEMRTIQIQLKQIQELRDNNAVLKLEIVSQKKDINSLSEELTSSKTSFREIEQRLFDDLDANKLLLKQYKGDNSNLVSDNSLLKQKIDSLEARNIQLESDFNTSQDHRSKEKYDAQVLISELQSSLEVVNRNYIELQNQFHENEIVYNGEIAQLTQRLSVHDTETSSSLAVQSTLKTRLEMLEKRAEKADQDHKLWENDMVLLANTTEDLNQLTLLHNKLINDYEAKVELVKTLEIERNNLKLDLASLKTVLSEKNNVITSLEIEKDSLSKHKNILLENQMRIEKHLSILSSEKDILVQTVSDLHIKNISHEEKINELNTIIVSRNRKIETFEKEAYNNSNQISVLKEENHNSVKSIENYKEKTKELNNIINILTRKSDILEVDLSAANNTNRLLKEEIGGLNHQVAKLNEEHKIALTAERERMEKKTNDIRASVMDDIQNLELQVSEERKISRKLSAIRESEKEVVEKGRKLVKSMLLDLNISNSNAEYTNVIITPSKSHSSEEINICNNSMEIEENSNEYISDDSKIYPLSRDIMRVASVVHPLKSKITELWKKVTAHYTSNNYYYNSNNSNHDSLIHFASLDEFLLDRTAIDNPVLDNKLSMFSLEQLVIDIFKRLDIFYLYQKESEKNFNEKQHNYEKVVNELRNLHATVQEKYEKYIQKKSTEEQVTKQEISALTDELNKFTKSCDRLQEENKSIRNQLDGMHDKYELLRQRKESDDDSSKQQINILQEDNSRYKGTIERLSDEHRRAVDALSQATQERLKLSYQLSTQTDINLQLAQETTKLSTIVEEQTTSFGKKESSMKEELDKLLLQNTQLTYQCESLKKEKQNVIEKIEILQSKLNEVSTAKNQAERLLKRFGDSLPSLSLHTLSASKSKLSDSVDRNNIPSAASKFDMKVPIVESKEAHAISSPESNNYPISSPFSMTPNASKSANIHDLLSKVANKKNLTTPSTGTLSENLLSSTKKKKEKASHSVDDNDEWNINGTNVSLSMSSPATTLSKSNTPIEKSKLDALKALYNTSSVTNSAKREKK